MHPPLLNRCLKKPDSSALMVIFPHGSAIRSAADSECGARLRYSFRTRPIQVGSGSALLIHSQFDTVPRLDSRAGRVDPISDPERTCISAILSIAVLSALTLAACSHEGETTTITVIASVDESLVHVQASNGTIPDGQVMQIWLISDAGAEMKAVPVADKHSWIEKSRTVTRIALGGFMTFAGIAHLSFAREEFQAQVPSWVPVDDDLVVLGSGIAEVTLGLALLLLPKHRFYTGIALALFYVAIFPGNIGQYVEGTDGFGLNTDTKRFVRLFFQPVLVGLALWAAGLPRRSRRERSAS